MHKFCTPFIRVITESLSFRNPGVDCLWSVILWINTSILRSEKLQGLHFQRFFSIMGTEDSKDLLKNVDWKTIGNASNGANTANGSSEPVVKKRLPKKIRQIPEYYFLPRRSLPSAIAIYGAICAAGVGAGMLVEIWINNKIKEDGGVVWEMDK